MRRRVAPRVLSVTTSRMRRKRVPATLEATITAPARMVKRGDEADHGGDALHHVLHNLHHVGDVDHRDGGELAVDHALQRGARPPGRTRALP